MIDNMTKQISRLFDFPYYQLNKNPQERCFNFKKGNEWQSISSKQYVLEANKVSASLLSLGIKPNDKIAIITENNNVNWHILDIGILQIGAQNIPLYATLSEKDYTYILQHSDATICFVSSDEIYNKVKAIATDTQLKNIFSLENMDTSYSWNYFLKLGEKENYNSKISTLKNNVKTDDLATIIYTSGTTGTPKGVMLSHKNIISAVFSVDASLQPIHKKPIRVISYLPICHIFERASNYFNQYNSAEIYFAESIEKLGDTIREVKPHYLAIVPRLLEKIFDKIVDKGSHLNGVKKVLFFWALNLAETYEPYSKNRPWYHFKLAIANLFIFSKWRKALGNNLQYMISGSAPLQPKLVRIFTAAKIPVFEGYGMTESSPSGSVNDLRNQNFKIGTVGKAVKGVELKIAEDGEILMKGDNIMLGYYKNPEMTAKTIIDGYLYTGDIGKIDAEGFLTITDRKKEIFKTSGGKYIAPAALESQLKQSRFIEQVLVVGEGEKMPAAIIQLNIDFVVEWAKRHQHKIKEISTDKKIRARIQKEIEYYNESFGKWEQIKKFEITPDEWTIEAGHLTPTLKMKRKIILKKYRSLYQKIYNVS